MEENDLKAVGRMIRRQRQAMRLGQKELADAMDVSVKTVGNWENGRNSPEQSRGALEEFLGIDLDTGKVTEPDPVIAAIKRSALTRANQARLEAAYYDLLDAQEREERGA